mgnify:CR=1 FL=1
MGSDWELCDDDDPLTMKVRLGPSVSSTAKDEDKDDNNTSFTLDTKDETLVKEVVQRFESAIREAKK